MQWFIFSENAGLTEDRGYVNFPMFMVTIIMLIVALLVPALASACAVCVTGANDPAADAYNWSVFFLLTAPYLVFGSIAGSLFLIYRRNVVRRNREESADLSLQIAWDQKENG
jgi:hypothetical protein